MDDWRGLRTFQVELIELEVQMSFTVDQIRDEALRLPIQERARLAGDLISSLDDLEDVDQAAVDAAWAEEIQRRVNEIRGGKVELLDGNTVMSELRRQFRK